MHQFYKESGLGLFKFLTSTLPLGLDRLNSGLEKVNDSLIEFNAQMRIKAIEGALEGSEYHLRVIINKQQLKHWSHAEEELLMDGFRKMVDKALSGDEVAIKSLDDKSQISFWKKYIDRYNAEKGCISIQTFLLVQKMKQIKTKTDKPTGHIME